MELNKKILKYGMFLIAVSLIFSIGFAWVYRVENPVFLKMYFEQYVSSNGKSDRVDNFELKYITDVSDSRVVKGIEFVEEPNIEVSVSNQPRGNGIFLFSNSNNNNNQGKEIYGRYAVHTIYLRMDINNSDREMYEIELNNAKVRFNDKSVVDTNLGRIILYKDKSKNEDIAFISSSGSNNGTSTSELNSKKNIKLVEVKSQVLEDLKDCFSIFIEDIDYKDISGIKYEKDKWLNIYAKCNTPQYIVEKYTYYDIKPKLYYEDEEANIAYIRLNNINYIPDGFDLKSLFDYLRARGAI